MTASRRADLGVFQCPFFNSLGLDMAFYLIKGPLKRIQSKEVGIDDPKNSSKQASKTMNK